MYTPSLATVRKYVDSGLVTERKHNTKPYSIFTYTPECQFSRAWDKVTLNTRGLIFDTQSGICIARSYPKFFNMNEVEETSFENLPEEIPVIQEKIDGSLIIVFWDAYNSSWEVATKGSFHSEQANYVRENLLEKYEKHLLEPIANYPTDTYLFEVIYPENRIVIDYGNARQLILHGRMTRVWRTGEFLDTSASILKHTRTVTPRIYNISQIGTNFDKFFKNREGYVLVYPSDPPFRVKVKSPDYVLAHRLVSSATLENTLSIMLAGEFKETFNTVPFHIRDLYDDLYSALQTRYNEILLVLSDFERKAQPLLDQPRKTLAKIVQETLHPTLHVLGYKIISGMDFRTVLGKTGKPLIWDVVLKTLKDSKNG